MLERIRILVLEFCLTNHFLFTCADLTQVYGQNVRQLIWFALELLRCTFEHFGGLGQGWWAIGLASTLEAARSASMQVLFPHFQPASNSPSVSGCRLPKARSQYGKIYAAN